MRRNVSYIISIICMFVFLTALNFTFALQQNYIIDGAGSFEGGELHLLEESAALFRENFDMDIVIVTADSLSDFGDGDALQVAEQIYDNYSYGVGDSLDGLLLLISFEERDWAIFTCGYATKVFDDEALDYVEGSFISYLSDGDYYEGGLAFINSAEYIATYYSEDPYYNHDDTPYMPDDDYTSYNEYDTGVIIKKIAITTGISLVVAFIIIMIEKSKMKTAVRQNDANDYISEALNIKNAREVFMYSRIMRTEKPKPQNNSGGSRGGSRGGGSRGGRSGKF